MDMRQMKAMDQAEAKVCPPKAKDVDKLELGKNRQNSSYAEGDKCRPDNNVMFDGKSNPMSSKGN